MPLLRGAALPAFLMCALIAAVYWPGLSGGFIFDDYSALVENAGVHSNSLDVRELWRAAFSFEPGGLGRPLAMATFGINHALGGLDPWGYKLGGLLVHLVNALLVFVLTSQLFAGAGVSEGRRRWGACALTAAWAVHPLQVSTVLYVVQRMETLSLTFVLAALIAYVHGRRRQVEGRRGMAWLLTSMLLGMVGLAAKESAVLLPAYTLALELTLLGFGGPPRVQKRLRVAYVVGAAAGLAALAFYVIPHYWTTELIAGRTFDTPQRLLTQMRILPMYAGQILLPLPATMPFYYDNVSVSTGWLSPWTTLAGALVIATALIAAWVLRKRAPLASLGVFWFFGAHVLTSSVIPLEIAFEHRNYFALLGLLLVVSDIIRRLRTADGPAFKYAASGVLIAGLATLCWIRAATWGDRLLLAVDIVQKNPASGRAAHELGVMYFEMADGRVDSPFGSLAQQQFEREAALPSSTILGEQALILMAASEGRQAKAEWWDGIENKIRARPVTPDTTQALFALLDNRLKGRRIDDRRLSDAFVRLFERVSLPPSSYVQVAGHALDQLHDEERAAWFLQRAIDVAGATPEFSDEVSSVLRKNGHGDLAVAIVRYAETKRRLRRSD